MIATLFNLVSGPVPFILLAVVIFFFGGKKIPSLARSIRKSLGEFKRGKEEGIAKETSRPNHDRS